jgi:signal transduction histidine kinase
LERTAELSALNQALNDEVAQRRQAEAALWIAKDKAEEANRAKSAFLSTMSHELRTPLNAIIGFSDILVKHAALSDERATDYLREINGSGIRLLDLINDILEITQMDTQDLDAADLVFIPDIVEAALAKVQPVADCAGVVLRSSVEEGLPLLRGDSRRLQKVLVNLLSNAIKFTGRGGEAFVTSRRFADGVTLEVIDTGVGMPPEAEAKISGLFSQIDSSLARKHDGIGLGLTFVRRVADHHGAVLEIASKQGAGTRVALAFPLNRIVKALEVA